MHLTKLSSNQHENWNKHSQYVGATLWDGCAAVPDHVGLAIKQRSIVSHPCGVSKVVLAGYEVEDACRPMRNQQRILQCNHATFVKQLFVHCFSGCEAEYACVLKQCTLKCNIKLLSNCCLFARCKVEDVRSLMCHQQHIMQCTHVTSVNKSWWAVKQKMNATECLTKEAW